MSFRSVKDPLEFIFEVQRKKETRKMSYASLPGFDMLHDNIESLYELRGESFSLKYVDPEGDKITRTPRFAPVQESLLSPNARPP